MLFLAALTFGAGCAKSDWIERTLVTVDVTGTWSGRTAGGGTWWFELEQQGSTVKGRLMGLGYVGLGSPPGSSLEGTVAGDVFRFRVRSGTFGGFGGELAVSGDEMTGEMWGSGITVGRGAVSFRRVDPSSLPAAPPQ